MTKKGDYARGYLAYVKGYRWNEADNNNKDFLEGYNAAIEDEEMEEEYNKVHGL